MFVPLAFHKESIVTRGLVLHLDAADRTSYSPINPQWNDLINNKKGTLINEPSFSPENGGSIEFNGINNYVIIPQSSGDFSQSVMTIDFWVKYNTFTSTGDMLLMDRPTYNGLYGIETFVLSATYPRVVVRGSSSVDLQSNTLISENIWTHICIIYSGPTAYIYINGQFDKTGIIDTVNPSNHPMHINNYPTLPGTYNSDSNWATLLIYHRALTTTEVTQNYNALKSRFGIL